MTIDPKPGMRWRPAADAPLAFTVTEVTDDSVTSDCPEGHMVPTLRMSREAWDARVERGELIPQSDDVTDEDAMRAIVQQGINSGALDDNALDALDNADALRDPETGDVIGVAFTSAEE